jgi:hypothetical protein
MQAVPGTLHPACFNVATALLRQPDQQLQASVTCYLYFKLASLCMPSFIMQTKRTTQCC